MQRQLLCLATAAISLVAFVGTASAQTTASITHTFTGNTSLKVIGVKGAKVFVEEKSDTVPAIFNYYTNRDAYVQVRVVRYGETIWSDKVELRGKHQTTVSLNYRRAPRRDHDHARTRPTGRRFVGTLYNTTQHCKASDQGDLKYQFMSGGTTVGTYYVKKGETRHSVELPVGTYDVRVFQQKGGQYAFRKTKNANVDKDGWTFSWGCKGSSRSVSKPARVSGKQLVNGHFKNYCMTSFKKNNLIYFGANPCGGAGDQRWQWPGAATGTIKNATTNYCLTFTGNSIKPATCNNSRSQYWSWRKYQGWWMISPASRPDLCLGITSKSAGNNYYYGGVGACNRARTSFWAIR